jgi:hypothetical protein
MEKALSLDPASTALLTEYGLFLYYDGQTESARAHCQGALELEPDSIAAQRCLYKVELIDKNFDVALNHALVLMSSCGAEASDIDSVASLPPLQGIAEFENWSFHQLEQRSNTEAVSPLLFAFSSAVLRKYDDAFYFLVKGYNEHYASVPLAMWDPIFIPIRHQSRFVKLADDMGIKFPSDF